MRIVYETMLERIQVAIGDAILQGKIIKQIELSESEWESLRRDNYEFKGLSSTVVHKYRGTTLVVNHNL